MNIIERCYWRTYYTIEELKYRLKYTWQRVFRGYDDNANWNLNDYLAPIIKNVTFDMSENLTGYPSNLTEEKWKQILKQISFGFGSYMEMQSGWYNEDEAEYKRLNKEFKKGLKLFVKYYNHLWD